MKASLFFVLKLHSTKFAIFTDVIYIYICSFLEELKNFMGFVRPVGYSASIPILMHNLGMPNFKVDISQRARQRETDDI
jgi:hypothetical protein